MQRIKKQIFHFKHEAYTKLACRLPFLPPYRHVFVLTNLCNMRCSNCFQEKNPAGAAMTAGQWMDLSDRIPAFSRITITGGEPLLFPGVENVLKNVAERHQCNLITNGLLINEELVDLFLSLPKFRILAISIDNLLSGRVNIRGYTEKQWVNLENILKIFVRRRNEAGSDCMLEIKTLILDENAEELFNIHRYCMETLGADHHTFQFLKGSPLQHSLKTVALGEVFKPSKAHVYEKFGYIIKELNRIKDYNIKNKKTSFLHPLVSDICTQKPVTDFSYINNERFEPGIFKRCSFPWSSVHINYDGEVFPCLSVALGNVKKDSLKNILRGKPYRDFLKAAKENGLFQACNRCGWLRPL